MQIQQELQSTLSNRQRWGNYLVIITAAIAFSAGLLLRTSIVSELRIYNNPAVGVTAVYPASWLIDDLGDYVFRIRDISARGYPSTIQIAFQTVGPDTQARNVVDAVTLDRASVLAAYRISSVDYAFQLPDETLGTRVDYSFVDTSVDPFLQTTPVVVQGRDVIVIQRGQALIISFQTNALVFNQQLRVFDQFLSRIEL